MRNFVALPVILLTVILQSAVISRVYLLSGIADLPLVMLAAWSLQEEVDSAWHWAAATGLLVGFISGIAWVVPFFGYLAVVAMARVFQQRVWQAPLLAMFSITFLGTIVVSALAYGVLRFADVPLPPPSVSCAEGDRRDNIGPELHSDSRFAFRDQRSIRPAASI